jgi:chromosome partitioning protein
MRRHMRQLGRNATVPNAKAHDAGEVMPVVAVINRKGGSGKSTLATQVAGCLAKRGLQVMLGDVDRQQSSLAWLRRRAANPLAKNAAIVGWAFGAKSVLRPPAGITHVVLDTPGGLCGYELARVVMSADAILIPVGDSIFDRESALECHAELMTLPRVASGRCKVGIVGMRLDARTKPAPRMLAWATEHALPYVGSVRESQLYPRGAESGLTVFDAEAGKVQADLAQWKPVMDWVEAAWAAAEKMESSAKTAVPVSAPSIARTAPATASRRRTLVRAPLPVPCAPASEFRTSREIVRPTPRAQRFGWLFTVFRAWA